ncbi:hypothetical protein Glove_117g243 [Diversispora epigaea]|uniref:BTB domain-containing protein n=1 Tax=Diversispora epigaea TaxID=1348612 RepID=A0A397J0I3_9GLOM|nr:hypothetical protein Glove_117g243 [Diversispora epigaea]
MALKFFDKLSQNFIGLLNDKDDYNVIIEIKNKKKSFTAHSNILKYRSSYFRRELENIHPNENNINTIIIKSSISVQILDIILSKKFNDLLNFCCNDIIAKHPSLIFERTNFNSLPESKLISFLKIENLQMKEVEIWDYVIKWGVAQNPTLPTNLGVWSKKNVITLKTTLQQCLPYIRYFHLSADEVRDSIRPYKKILDKQLWKDIKYHLSSPKKRVKSIILPSRSFSTIISEDHAAEISTWIDHETTTYTSLNYLN